MSEKCLQEYHIFLPGESVFQEKAPECGDSHFHRRRTWADHVCKPSKRTYHISEDIRWISRITSFFQRCWLAPRTPSDCRVPLHSFLCWYFLPVRQPLSPTAKSNPAPQGHEQEEGEGQEQNRKQAALFRLHNTKAAVPSGDQVNKKLV